MTPTNIIGKLRSRILLLIITVLGLIPNLRASHIVGGEMNYRCLGGSLYEISLTVFRDCYTAQATYDNPAAIGIFDANNNLRQTVYINRGTVTQIPPTINQVDQCVKIPTNICIETTTYTRTVNLPSIPGGYQLVYQRCCRNPTIVNVPNPDNVGATYYAFVPPTSVVTCNSNPVINEWPPVFVCRNQQLTFDHSATDADGDSLVYSLCTPYTSPSSNVMPQPPFKPPYNNITWKAPYTQNDPMGGVPLTIDANGQLTGTPTNVGQYVVGVCVSEYRNGVYLSTTKRDFQFNVLNCEKDVVTAIGDYNSNCLTNEVTFTNNSTGAVSYLWDFGDSSQDPNDTSTTATPTYTFPGPGSYQVTLIGYSGNSVFCNDTVKNFPLTVAPCTSCDVDLAKVDATVCEEFCDTVTHDCSAVRYDRKSSSKGSTTGSAWSITWNHFMGPGPNRMLIVPVVYTGAGFPTTATYGGQALTLIASQSNGNTSKVQLWYLKNPSVGSAQVVVNFQSNVSHAVTSAISYHCVDQTSPFYAINSSGIGLGTPTSSLSGGGTGNLIIDVMGINSSSTTTAGAGQSLRWSDSQGSAIWGHYSDEPANGGSVTMDYNGTGTWAKMTRSLNRSNDGVHETEYCTGGGVGDGTIDLTVNSGNAPFNYTWDNGATQEDLTGLLPGVYHVTVDDGGTCQDTGSVVIDGNSVLSLSTGMTSAACGSSNGTATVTVTGGTGQYLWSDGQTNATATGLLPGTYTVYVTDSVACSRSDTITVTEGTVISLTPSPTDLFCNEDSTGIVSVTPNNGTAPFTYAWSPGGETSQTVTGLLAGTYTVTVNDVSLCTGTRTLTITEPDELTVSATPSAVLCYGDIGSITLTPTGGSGGYTYLWSDGQTDITATGLTQGDYIVTVTDVNGCSFELETELPGPLPLTPEVIDTSTIDCIGNFNGAANLYVSGGTAGFTYLWCDGQTTQNVSGLPTGNCIVTVTDANGCVATSSLDIVDPGVLTLAMDTTNLVCTGDSNGTATVIPAGGVPGYTYLWCNGETTQNISDLKAQTCNVTVTDANGCISTIDAEVTEPAAMAGNPVVTDVACNSGNDGQINLATSGGTSPYTYQWDDPASHTSTSVTGLTAGSYQVTITDVNGCVGYDTATVTEPTVLAVNTTGNNSSCGQPDGDVTATPSGGTSGYTYQWNDANSQTTANATGLPAGGYTVTVTDAQGCTQTANVNISDDLAPTTSTSGTNLLCNGDADGTATVLPSGGAPGYTYQWNDGGSQTSATATGLTAGNYNVTVTDMNGCISANTYQVTQPTVVSLLSSGNDETCTATNGTVTVTASGGVGGYTYVWDDASGQTTATATGLPAGTYQVTATDANGCPKTISATIGDQPSPVASATGNASLCNTDPSGTATVTLSGGTSPFVYVWDDGSNQTTATATGLIAGTYIVTVTDNNGCIDTSLAVISEPTALSLSSSGSDETCTNSNGTVTVVASGGTSGYTYVWNDAGSQTSATATGLPAGTYMVTTTDANGCTDTVSVIIGDQASPLATATGSASLCNADPSGSATVTMAGGTTPFTYVWDDGSGQTTATATGLIAGTYMVTVTDANGCSDTSLAVIGEPTVLGMTVSATTALCGQPTGTGTASPTGGTPAYSYLWEDGQTTATATGLPKGYSAVTVTDANGCMAEDSVDVPETPSTTATTTGIDLTCYGIPDGSGTAIPAGGMAPFSYLWSDANSQTSATATGLSPGTYIVTVTDVNGCDTVASVTISQPPQMVIDIGNDTSVCDNSALTIGSTATGGTPGYTYQWNDASGSTTQYITVVNGQTTIYTVTVTDASGCTITDDRSVDVNTVPTANFSSTQLPTCDGVRLTFTNSSVNGVNYIWDFGDGNTSTEFEPEHVFEYSTNPVITLVATNGVCIDTLVLQDSLKSFEEYQVFTVPNVFTPNGDGHNDYFKINTFGELAECTSLSMIMNRWGVLIYEPPAGKLSWDGMTAAGLPVPEGTYFYVVKVKDIEYKGWIHLIRSH